MSPGDEVYVVTEVPLFQQCPSAQGHGVSKATEMFSGYETGIATGTLLAPGGTKTWSVKVKFSDNDQSTKVMHQRNIFPSYDKAVQRLTWLNLKRKEK